MKAVAAVVVVVLAIAGGAVLWHERSGDEPVVVAPEPQIVDPAVPESKLLASALYVQAWRDFGKPVGFRYVPRTRPPGLISIGPGNPPDLTGGDHGLALDAYTFQAGAARLFGAVEFAPGPTSTCADTRGMTHAVCVRDKSLDADDADLRHTTVYFTADSAAALAGPAAAEARRFWADVAFVPVEQAAWFSDLVTQARAHLIG